MAARFGLFLSVLLLGYSTATVRAETPEEWASVLSRVHGGFGSFLPVGIRIGEDAMKRLNSKPREMSVLFYQGEDTPCPCAADGVMLAVYASPGQGTLQIASERSPPGSFAMVVIKPRKGGDGLKYTVPMSFMPKLGQINSTIQDPVEPIRRSWLCRTCLRSKQRSNARSASVSTNARLRFAG